MNETRTAEKGIQLKMRSHQLIYANGRLAPRESKQKEPRYTHACIMY